jgi:hypothetical protein
VITATTFSITTPAASVELEQNRVGEVPFTVTNLTDNALRVRARIVPAGATPSEWLTIEGEAERDFAAGDARQFVVRIEPPLGAPAGTYQFRLDAIGVEHPDDDYAEGPSCQATVPPSTGTKLTTARGYLATLVGALAGGLLGELVVVVLILTSHHHGSNCSGFGCVVGDTIGDVLALLFFLFLGFVLMIIGAGIGAAVALRIRGFLGPKLTGLFLSILMVPWTILMLATLFQLVTSLVVIAILAPIVLVAVPAVLARGAVLLIRTHHI